MLASIGAAVVTLHLVFVPNPAFIQATAAAGTLVATAKPYWSNGQTFRGYLCVIGPNAAFRLKGRRVVVASTSALRKDAGTTQYYKVEAAQYRCP